MFRSIRAKLFLSSMTLIVLAVVAMAFIHYKNARFLLVDSRQAVDTKAVANYSLLLKQYVKRLEYEFDNYTKLYSEKSKILYSEPEFKGYFEKLGNSFPTVSFVSEQGEVPIVVGRQVIDRSHDMKKARLFEAAVKKPNEAQFELERIGGQLYLVFFIFRKSFFDEFNGGYGAYIPFKKVVADLELVTLDKEGVLGIFDTFSKTLYNVADESTMPVGTDVAAALESCAGGKGECGIKMRFLAKESFVTIRPDPYLNLSLVYGIPEHVLLRSVNESILNIVITAFVLIGLTLLVNHILSRKLTLPLSLLTRAVEKFGQGDFTAEIDIKTGDEVGELASSFRKMVKDINDATVSKDYVENIIHSISDMIFVVNEGGAIAKVNRSVTERLQTGEMDLITTPVERLIEGFEFKEILKTGEGSEAAQKTYWFKLPQGERLPVKVSFANLRDDKNTVSSYIMVLQDMTAALREAESAKRVGYLVDNMQEAMFSITPDFKVIEPVSKFSGQVFGQEIENKDLLDTVFKDVPREGEAFKALTSALHTVFGEDDLQWMLMESNFPEKIEYRSPGEEAAKILKVKATPLWNQDGMLEKILFVIGDITELELREKKNQEQQRTNSIIEDIIRCKADRFAQVTAQAVSFLQAALAHDYLNLGEEACSQVYRDLHTIKGNARFLGLTKLSGLVHEAESKVLPLMADLLGKDADKTKPAEIMVGQLQMLLDLVKEYRDVEQRSFQSRGASTTSIPQEYVASFLSLFKEVGGRISFEPLARLRQFVMFGSGRSLQRTVDELAEFVRDLSARRNKPVHLSSKGDDVILDPQVYGSVSDALGHLVRNAFDHGVEPLENRREHGKADQAKIQIAWEQSGNMLNIEIVDDGQGFDLERIRRKLVEKNHLSADEANRLTEGELIEWVFKPKFSTADTVSETSGRGVGLDAVKSSIDAVRGEIKVTSQWGIGTTISLRVPAPAQNHDAGVSLAS